MNADSRDSSMLQRPSRDAERRTGEIFRPTSPRFCLLLNRAVFSPRKDTLRPAPAINDAGIESPGAPPRKRPSGQMCPMLHAGPSAATQLSSPTRQRLLPTYRPLASRPSNSPRGQAKRVQDDKSPSDNPFRQPSETLATSAALACSDTPLACS